MQQTHLGLNLSTKKVCKREFLEQMQQASSTDRELAQRYGIGVDTVRNWRLSTAVDDASHTAHRLQTTLNAAQKDPGYQNRPSQTASASLSKLNVHVDVKYPPQMQ